MKDSVVANVLRAAKPFLETEIGLYGKTEYICHAIDETKYSIDIKHYVKRWIIVERMGVIDNYSDVYHDVGSWLRDVIKVPKRDLTYGNLQNFRHRWLDSLIKEFS